MNSKKNLTYLSPYLKINRFLLGLLITQILVLMSFSISLKQKPKIEDKANSIVWFDPIEQVKAFKEEKPQPKKFKPLEANPFSLNPEEEKDKELKEEKDEDEPIVDLKGLEKILSGLVLEMKKPDEKEIYDAHLVSEMPEFPGGNEALIKFIKKNFNKPHLATLYEIQGATFMTFVIDTEGKVSEITILHPDRALGYGIEDEASRAISLMPKWKPGKQGSRPVSVRYILPIHIVQ
jgi:periplasmic protein TonB